MTVPFPYSVRDCCFGLGMSCGRALLSAADIKTIITELFHLPKSLPYPESSLKSILHKPEQVILAHGSKDWSVESMAIFFYDDTSSQA